MVSPDEELEILFPDRTFDLNGLTVEVSPFKFKHWATVFGILKKYGSAISESDFIGILMGMGEEAVGDLRLLTLISANLTAEELDEMNGDDAIALFFKVFEVNADFFVRGIQQGSEAVGRRLGQTESKSSSPTVTLGETSKTTA